MNLEKDDKSIDIPNIEDHHYYLFNSTFDANSTGDALKFILARNLMKKDRPKFIKFIIKMWLNLIVRILKNLNLNSKIHLSVFLSLFTHIFILILC